MATRMASVELSQTDSSSKLTNESTIIEMAIKSEVMVRINIERDAVGSGEAGLEDVETKE